MSAWFRGKQGSVPVSGAPPEGVSGSEQSVENESWRIQLDLATGGVRSLLLRGWGKTRELADPEALPHPFQGILRDQAGSLVVASRFIQARFRFDETGGSLAVDSSLAQGVWKSVFRVNAGDPVLGVTLEWSGLAPGMRLEMPLPLMIPGVVDAGGRLEGGVVELTGEAGRWSMTLRASGNSADRCRRSRSPG